MPRNLIVYPILERLHRALLLPIPVPNEPEEVPLNSFTDSFRSFIPDFRKLLDYIYDEERFSSSSFEGAMILNRAVSFRYNSCEISSSRNLSDSFCVRNRRSY